ncbi:hypothetical protein QBC44DRAFT_104343 [Cladorrhinum sp. PSN332]|nr:hypothetical protein QBC44DRAFT_104343 [Cladorrhinum sp. PSN332]
MTATLHYTTTWHTCRFYIGGITFFSFCFFFMTTIGWGGALSFFFFFFFFLCESVLCWVVHIHTWGVVAWSPGGEGRVLGREGILDRGGRKMGRTGGGFLLYICFLAGARTPEGVGDLIYIHLCFQCQ